MNPQLSNGGLYLRYYKKETMMNNQEARVKVVLPDVEPLPSMISDINLMKQNKSHSSISDLKPSTSQTDEEFYQTFFHILTPGLS